MARKCPKKSLNLVNLIDLHPHTRSYRKISAICYYPPPPPTESGPLTGIPEKFCYYPPPTTECGPLRGTPENVCYYPPPTDRLPEMTKKVAGGIGRVAPPQTKILATPLILLLRM